MRPVLRCIRKFYDGVVAADRKSLNFLPWSCKIGTLTFSPRGANTRECRCKTRKRPAGEAGLSGSRDPCAGHALQVVLMPRTLLDQLFAPVRQRGQAISQLPVRWDRSVIWLHADTARAAQVLARFSETLLQRAPDIGILLTAPEFDAPTPELPGRISLIVSADPLDATQLVLDQLKPAVVLIAAQILPAAMIRLLGRAGVPVFVIESATPSFASRWQRFPMVARSLLAQIEKVFVQNDASHAAWRDMGLSEDAIIRSGRLSGMPVALGCNETEREELSESFRHRAVWLAAGLPEKEEAAVLAAHREALRESHRLALILQPADPMRGPALRALCADHFVTALRSIDDPVLPETQVYIVDTEGERGLWYRLAVACFLGGTLGAEGATLNPMEAAGLGCAIVHGRMFGRHAEAFDLLRDAGATRMIQSAEALGAAICTALRPEQAADQAHRAWQVISSGSEATETVMAALLARCAPGDAG